MESGNESKLSAEQRAMALLLGTCAAVHTAPDNVDPSVIKHLLRVCTETVSKYWTSTLTAEQIKEVHAVHSEAGLSFIQAADVVLSGPPNEG